MRHWQVHRGCRHADDPLYRLLRLRRGPLDAHLDIAALQLEFSDVLLDQKLDKFFDLFLVHAFPVSV